MWQVIKVIQGNYGYRGEPGDPGYPGNAGTTGNRGTKGATGDTGDTGDTGAKGADGDKNPLGFERAAIIGTNRLAFYRGNGTLQAAFLPPINVNKLIHIAYGTFADSHENTTFSWGGAHGGAGFFRIDRNNPLRFTLATALERDCNCIGYLVKVYTQRGRGLRKEVSVTFIPHNIKATNTSLPTTSTTYYSLIALDQRDKVQAKLAYTPDHSTVDGVTAFELSRLENSRNQGGFGRQAAIDVFIVPADGVQGDKGVKGSRGIAGNAGVNGADGRRGRVGATGKAGNDGKDGLVINASKIVSDVTVVKNDVIVTSSSGDIKKINLVPADAPQAKTEYINHTRMFVGVEWTASAGSSLTVKDGTFLVLPHIPTAGVIGYNVKVMRGKDLIQKKFIPMNKTKDIDLQIKPETNKFITLKTVYEYVDLGSGSTYPAVVDAGGVEKLTHSLAWSLVLRDQKDLNSAKDDKDFPASTYIEISEEKVGY